MRKITLLFTLLFSAITFAQGTIEVLSYPSTFAQGTAIFGPAQGEDPIVIRFTKITHTTVDCPAPIRTASVMVTDLNGLIIPASGDLTDIDGTNSKHNIGGTNIGFSTIHQKKAQDATFPDNIKNYVDHGDGTMSFDFIHTRWSQGGGQTFGNGTAYTLIQRIWNRTDGKTSSAISVKDNGGAIEVGGMTYDNAATIETEANLFARATAVLSSSKFVKQTISVGPNPVSDILKIDSKIATKNYRVFNAMGAEVKTLPATGSADVSGLSSGLYFLVTDAGVAKFVKK